jgi:hypothetical protein
MPTIKPAARNRAKGCGCLVVALLLVVGGCSALFGNDDRAPASAAYTPAPIPSYRPWTPEPRIPRPVASRGDDGVADRYDDDGDGATTLNDIDGHDPSKGKRPKRKKTRQPRPQPQPEPIQVGNVRPGGFCGTPGAVGTSRGRIYRCRGGHWRR